MRQRPFIRKVIYLLLMAALLAPLSLLSQPTTQRAGGEVASPGGKLSQLRERYELSQANLGEIDPAAETIRLASLGMRGVAGMILWNKVHKYQVASDWSNLDATLKQLALVQSNYIGVWIFQAWNVSFNIAVEWDDYHDRFYYVLKGEAFLEEGTRHNDKAVRLINEMAWVAANKIGTADERVQYRKLFKDRWYFEDLFKTGSRFLRDRTLDERDNWLVGKEIYLESQQIVDDDPMRLGKFNPLVFHAKPALCQINFAAALEEDGTFEERARVAWQKADNEWSAFALRQNPGTEGELLRIADLEVYAKSKQAADDALDALSPGLRETILAEKRAALTAKERQALDSAPAARTDDESRLAANAEPKLRVTNDEILVRLSADKRAKGQEFANESKKFEMWHNTTQNDIDSINFHYWKVRCKAESTPAALEARRLVYEANEAFVNDADLLTARQKFEQGFKEWRKVLNEFPDLVADSITGANMETQVQHYENVLKQLDLPMPKNFILQDLVDKHRDPSKYFIEGPEKPTRK